jgi:dipeptidase E
VKNATIPHMKLFLSSAGIRTPKLANALSDLVGKPLEKINVGIINEAAAVEHGSKRWMINELNDLAKYIGGEIDFIDLLALSPNEMQERLAHTDVIYVVGGNPDYLMYLYNKTEFGTALQETLLKYKVYVGSSAGSMVLTQKATTEQYLARYTKQRAFGIKQYLGIVDIIFRPHMASSDNPKYDYKALKKVATGLNSDLYALRDDQAIIIDEGTMSFIGGDAFKIKKVNREIGMIDDQMANTLSIITLTFSLDYGHLSQLQLSGGLSS